MGTKPQKSRGVNESHQLLLILADSSMEDNIASPPESLYDSYEEAYSAFKAIA
jgi:hypothetical protein